MKVQTTTTMLILSSLLVAFAPMATAQLTGFMTIGGSPADYATIEEAILDLNVQGVGAGGVTFLIRDGVYNENDNLNIVDVNASADAPVVFRPDTDADVEININIIGDFSSAFRFQNSDYINFNGTPQDGEAGSRHLVVNGYRNEDDDIFVFWLSNGSDHCTLENMTISSISDPGHDSGWSTPIYCSTYEVTTPEIGMDSFTLANCEVIGASTWTVFLDGGEYALSNFNLIGNTIRDFQKYGIRLTDDAIDCNIEGNEIHQTFDEARSSVYGISVLSGNTGTRIHHNYIHDLKHSETSGTRGIYLYGNGNGNLVHNNIISLIPGPQANKSYCIARSSGGGIGNRIYYNTLYMGGTDERGIDSYCLRLYGEATDIVVKNNLLLNERTGGGDDNAHCALMVGYVDSAGECDYNFLSVNSDAVDDNRYVAMIGSGSSATYYNTLADLRDAPGYSPRDQNSITGDAELNATDLHLQGTSICIGGGTPLGDLGILTDFDYDIRDEVNPDIGADEFMDLTPVEGNGSVFSSRFLEVSNYPNPFNPRTRIEFELPWATGFTLKIFDIEGRLVDTLHEGCMGEGHHSLEWRGVDDKGRNRPSGVYLYRIESDSFHGFGRMVLLK